MKKILFMLLFIASALPARAEDSSREEGFLKFLKGRYVGVHGNQSYSKMWDKKDLFHDDTLERIDNGDAKAYSFSLTGGFDLAYNFFDTTDNFKVVIGGEIFFDHINKTVVQGDKPMMWGGWGLPRPMANSSVFKNKYLIGARGELGFRLFQRVDIYGHIGLTYWGRDWYLYIDDTEIYNKFYEDPNWKLLPIYGLGATIHITENWAANISYSIIRQTVYITNDRNDDDYNYVKPEIGINVLTVGVVYYF